MVQFNLPQNSKIEVNDGENVLNFCANNYLGLASNPTVIKKAKQKPPDNMPKAAPG